MSNLKYRPDIDGLRAIAILSVVLFHAFPNMITSGFVGVDIFFVISGFLISSIIFREIDNNSFSFIDFFSRRIRRIFPALILVMLSVYIFGWFYLLKGEYKQLGQHIFGGGTFISNFLYLKESGYFDTEAETKPLLHLWSLAIEEQFYLFWPVIIYFSSKKKFNILTVTLLVFFTSFIYSLIKIKINNVAAFYLPLSRFWELMVGTLAAYIMIYKADKLEQLKDKFSLNNSPSVIGFLLITLSIFVTQRESFPGFFALLPTIGAALIIMFGQGTWLNKKLLENKFMVWIGLISFPLYLWHWPLLSFAHILSDTTPSKIILVLMVVLSVIFSVITYFFVEKPLRFGKHLKLKALVLFLLLISLAVVGKVTYKKEGIIERSIAKQGSGLDHYSYFNGKSEEEYWGDDACFLLYGNHERYIKNKCDKGTRPNRPKVMIVGDSLSAYLSIGLREFLEEKEYDIYQFSTAHCAPLAIEFTDGRCYDMANFILNKTKEIKPDYLLIFAHYFGENNVFHSTKNIEYDGYIRDLTHQFKKDGVKKIIVIGMIPSWEKPLPSFLMRNYLLKRKPLPNRLSVGIEPRSFKWDERMKKLDYSDNTTYISVIDFLCNAEGCLTNVTFDGKNDLIAFDHNHFTATASRYVTRNLLAEYFK